MIKIPEDLQGKELFKFLILHKKELITQKKSCIKFSDPINFQPSIITDVKQVVAKSLPNNIINNEFNVKVACNAAWWCDNGMDVLIDTSYDKSIKDRGILIPHIADHSWKSTSHVGDVKAVYTQMINLRDLGLKMTGKTTCAIMETTVIEDYNALTYKFYKNGKINQHSIGFAPISIGLCINDGEYLPNFELWNKYYDRIINKELVNSKGYFWVMPEIKWMENSCVLFGMNELTPTLDITDTIEEPQEESTLELPPTTTKGINFKSLIKNKK